ncbi:Periplasmic [NiFeSe] hydrogenase small subunit [bacterium HR26]|nr:Periplasmic [NiFeSe] hydrogenase small subunit [bacterium HR26]
MVVEVKPEVRPKLGMVGNVAGATTEEIQHLAREQLGRDSLLGPYTHVHVFWLAGMSCDGCTISVLGAVAPRVEDLLMGSLPGLPQILLHHSAVNVESGDPFVEPMQRALEGTLGAPYVIVYEGSVPDETRAGDGYWSAVGEEFDERTGQFKQVPSSVWLKRLAPGAAAVIAIGTCATWGGIPAAYHNATGAMSVMDFLGRDYRSALGLPVVNIPGCAPVGDNFTETVAAVLLFLQGLGPVPEFDELGRPAWLFGETVHRQCTRAGYYEEGVFAEHYGDRECLVEIGCWGPVVNCNITARGALNGLGGCMNVGGPCIGCTMPGFPDKFSPFYKAPPGSTISGTISRLNGSFIRPLRRITQRDRNRETRWDRQRAIPSGWGAEYDVPIIERTVEFFYNRLRWRGSSAKPE